MIKVAFQFSEKLIYYTGIISYKVNTYNKDNWLATWKKKSHKNEIEVN